ncbi:HAD-IA family hydrolase [candidate division KSB1 bacterium]
MKAIIFDLDDTLYDCTKQVIFKAINDAVKAMKKAGLPFNAEKFASDIKKRKGRDTFRVAIDNTFRLKKYRTNDSQKFMKVANKKYYNHSDVSNIKLFPGAEKLLKDLKKRKMKLALVSTGTKKQQMRKVKNLKLNKYFDVVAINDVFKKKGKGYHFKKIMKKFKLKPKDVLVVGNKPSSEIKAGNKLGIKTVQVTVVCDYKPKYKIEKPDFKIKNVTDLSRILEG